MDICSIDNCEREPRARYNWLPQHPVFENDHPSKWKYERFEESDKSGRIRGTFGPLINAFTNTEDCIYVDTGLLITRLLLIRLNRRNLLFQLYFLAYQNDLWKPTFIRIHVKFLVVRGETQKEISFEKETEDRWIKWGEKRKGASEICDPRQRAAISQSNANNARYWNELRQLSCLVDSENAESARADRSFANVSSREGNIRECTRHRSKFKRRVESVTCCWNSRTP